MHDFAPFTPELLGALRAATKHPAVQQLHFAQLVNPLCGLKGHFILANLTLIGLNFERNIVKNPLVTTCIKQ
jgi:hypothetical protein